MKSLVQRKKRELEEFDDVDEILNLIKTRFKDTKFYTAVPGGRVEISINEFLSDNTLLIVTDTSFRPADSFSIYGLMDKYVELELSVKDTRAPGYFHCEVLAFKKASGTRRGARFKVGSGEAVVTNFRIANRDIEISDTKIPTFVKVLMDQFKADNSGMADIFTIDVFSRNESDPILKEVKKTGKNVLIGDSSDPDSYKSLNDNFVDVASLYGSNLSRLIKFNMEKGYKSIVIVPLIYLFDDQGDALSFGYIKLISKDVSLGVDDVFDFKASTLTLLECIRDANTQYFTVRQAILDVSRDGIRMRITDEALKSLIVKANGFIFDIVFKYQAPITMYGEIRYTFADKEGLVVGISFAGNSFRQEELERFDAILSPMEAAYRANLLKKVRES